MQTTQGHTSEEGSSSDETANVTLDRAHSSTVSLTITLPSVSSTSAAGAFKPGLIADLEETRQGSNAPTTVVSKLSSPQRHRRKNSPTSAWYAVGASLGAILSPHRPRYERLWLLFDSFVYAASAWNKLLYVANEILASPSSLNPVTLILLEHMSHLQHHCSLNCCCCRLGYHGEGIGTAQWHMCRYPTHVSSFWDRMDFNVHR